MKDEAPMINDQTVTQALMPCPRCGGQAFVTIQFGVMCEVDRCLHLPPRANREEAITAWNTRTAHSGEGRSNGAGEDTIHREREAVLQNKRVNDAIQTAIERGELTVSPNGYLAALSAPQGEMERLRATNYASFTDGMEAAAEICGSLAETTFDDADGFAAATGCEAAIMRVVREQRAEQAKEGCAK